MTKRFGAVSFVYGFSIGLLALTVAALHYSPAHAQSADLVLCDRLAAEPADPDRPADVKGTPVIAQSDIATAIKFCSQVTAIIRYAPNSRHSRARLECQLSAITDIGRLP